MQLMQLMLFMQIMQLMPVMQVMQVMQLMQAMHVMQVIQVMQETQVMQAVKLVSESISLWAFFQIWPITIVTGASTPHSDCCLYAFKDLHLNDNAGFHHVAFANQISE